LFSCQKEKQYIQYNLVKPPPSVQPDFGVITSLAIICPARFWRYNEFGDKLCKDRKPKGQQFDFKFGMTDGLILTSLPEMSIITYNLNSNILVSFYQL
jgi:hypothetical protein